MRNNTARHLKINNFFFKKSKNKRGTICTLSHFAAKRQAIYPQANTSKIWPKALSVTYISVTTYCMMFEEKNKTTTLPSKLLLIFPFLQNNYLDFFYYYFIFFALLQIWNNRPWVSTNSDYVAPSKKLCVIFFTEVHSLQHSHMLAVWECMSSVSNILSYKCWDRNVWILGLW